MLNCKDMTKLISDSLERKISVRQHRALASHHDVRHVPTVPFQHHRTPQTRPWLQGSSGSGRRSPSSSATCNESSARRGDQTAARLSPFSRLQLCLLLYRQLRLVTEPEQLLIGVDEMACVEPMCTVSGEYEVDLCAG